MPTLLPPVTFFPGPSKVFPEVKNFMAEAFDAGLLSISHRSETFNQLSEATIKLLKSKLNIPDDYWVFYTTSATESWEIIPQSLTKHKSVHFYNGSFGEKWFQYTQKIHPSAEAHPFKINQHLNPWEMEVAKDAEIICLTHNETSNGTRLPEDTFSALREMYPNQLIAVDVTSSIFGTPLPFSDADIWYGSVQKCFGLPAGLGLLIVSPRALDVAKEIADRKHYDSLLTLQDNMAKFQTSHTPNVLGIYLLKRVLETQLSPEENEHALLARAQRYYKLIDQLNNVCPLIENVDVRSQTVIAVQVEDKALLPRLKAKAIDSGLLLGSGYGQWKESTFRIANFPAIQVQEVDLLCDFLIEELG